MKGNKTMTTNNTIYTPEFCKKLLNDLRITIYGQDEKQRIHGHNDREFKFIIKRKEKLTHNDLILICGGNIADKYIARSKQKQCNEQYSVQQVSDVFRLESEKNTSIKTVEINIDEKTMIEMLKFPDTSIKKTIDWMWIFDPDLYFEKFGDARVEDVQRAMIKERRKLRKALQ